MRDVQFDAFGEAVAGAALTETSSRSRVSKIVTRAGVGLFWSLVAVIVAARVVYFDPDLARTFGAFAANCVHAFLNG